MSKKEVLALLILGMVAVFPGGLAIYGWVRDLTHSQPMGFLVSAIVFVAAFCFIAYRLARAGYPRV